MKEMQIKKRPRPIEFWFEPLSWALPLRIGVWSGYRVFEFQIGPFGFNWYGKPPPPVEETEG